MSRGIHVCADDYGLAPGVSDAIRTLASMGRLSGTSVMTLFPGLGPEAVRLRQMSAGRRFSIGLHVTLTGGFAPLAGSPLGEAHFPSLGRLLRGAFGGKLKLDAVAAEVEAQFRAFEDAFGAAPTHVDGHQHAHLLPGIRPIVLEAARRHSPGALVRDCTQASAARIGFDAKGRFISLLARGLARDARARGLRVNTGFAGAYDLKGQADFGALFARFVRGLGDGGMVMVHPGHVDDVLAARDPVLDARETEYAFLASPRFLRVMEEAQAHLL